MFIFIINLRSTVGSLTPSDVSLTNSKLFVCGFWLRITPYVEYIFGENQRGFEHIRLIIYHVGWPTFEFRWNLCVVLLAKWIGLI